MSTYVREERRDELAAERREDGIPARVFLQPIAAPSILGLFGLSAAMMMVAAHLAGWYGSTTSPEFLFPFTAIFGGIAQFMAGMWAYRARDGLATAIHGTWGSFWIAYGILWGLIAAGTLSAPSGAWPELGFWFIMLAAITLMGALASLGESLGLFSVLSTLAAGSAILAAAYFVGSTGWEKVGGWVLVFSAGFAWYVASAMLLAAVTGRTILPLFRYGKLANVPGGRPTQVIQLEHGEPGVRRGQ
jgi:succinate-acetate transporter protein